ncbi:hypothetical protein ACVWWO_009139 [Bradyrhizobium sp. F1.13.1]
MTAKAPHRQYTGFQKPAMAFFAHPLKVRLSYFNCVDYKPHFAPETAVCRIRLPKGAVRHEASDHGHAAVDVDGLAGDIGRFVRTQVDGGRRDVLWRPQAIGRNLG